MTEKELKKEYDRQWKEEQPQRYFAWLTCCIEAWIPIAVALVQMIGGVDRQKLGIIAICVVIFLLLETISAIIIRKHEKGWPRYLEENRERLKSGKISR